MGEHRERLLKLPKVELHRHLVGSLRWQTVVDIANRYGFSGDFRDDVPLRDQILVTEPMDDLQQVLTTFVVLQRCFVDYPVVQRIAFEIIEDAARENIKLLELRFSPAYLCHSADLDWDRLTEAILKGIGEAQSRYDIVVGLIVVVSRSFGPEPAAKVLDYARRWRRHLVGFDLADDEIRWPNHHFEPMVHQAAELGLKVTIHSGEGTPASCIRDSIERMGALRIGHGVTVGDDPALLQQCIDQGIYFEMCPTSNVITKSATSIEQHPILPLLRRGLKVTVNSDDPGLFGIDLTHDMEALVQCGATMEELGQLTFNALEGSFVSDADKATVREKLAGWD